MGKCDGVFTNRLHALPRHATLLTVNGPQSAPSGTPIGCGKVERRRMPRQGKCSQTPLSAVSAVLQLPALKAPSYWGWGSF